MSGTGRLLPLYPLEHYFFGQKAPQVAKDASLEARMARFRRQFAESGQRRVVEAVVLVHQHAQPHVLLLQLAPGAFKLPGGRLRPGEGEEEGLKRKLSKRLAPNMDGLGDEVEIKWEIESMVSMWWRPNFEPLLYPYCPAHITRPKECRKLFVVRVAPNKARFAVPANFKLVAVPLFELYDKSALYGNMIASLPQILSSYSFSYQE